MGEGIPCEECRSDAPIALDYSRQHSYREWAGPSLKLDSGALLGLSPVLELEAAGPSDCPICHSYSPDALEFDFATWQDSLLRAFFPATEQVLLLPGSHIPERDSTWWFQWQRSLAKTLYADQAPLTSLAPWQGRSGEAIYRRPLPKDLRHLLGSLGGRLGLRYLALPLRLRVELKPKEGKKGAYDWESLWTLWDLREGSLLLLDYRSFYAATSNSTPPDRQWSKPWAEALGQALRQGPRSDEPH